MGVFGGLDIKLSLLGSVLLKGPWPKVSAVPAGSWTDGEGATVIYAVRRLDDHTAGDWLLICQIFVQSLKRPTQG